MENEINMKYIDLALKVKNDDIETASAILEMVSPYGFSVEDNFSFYEKYKEHPRELIDQELLKKDRTMATLHLYIEEKEDVVGVVKRLEDLFIINNIKFSLEKNILQEKDYANLWKKYYNPIEIGESIVVVPSWEEYENKEDKILITLDPGMAFGTGTHETTTLCMEYLEQVVKKGDSILDIGSGSGILGITAVLLGAKSSLGIDIDQVAVRVGKENSKINKVEDRVEFLQADLTKGLEGRYDLIVANIVAEAIITLSKDARKYLKNNGMYIVSGIILEKKDEVIRKVEESGFKLETVKEKKGWVAILFKGV